MCFFAMRTIRWRCCPPCTLYNSLRMAGVGGLARILLLPEFVLQVLAERFGREIDLDTLMASNALVI